MKHRRRLLNLPFGNRKRPVKSSVNYTLIDTIAFALLISLATYFILQSAEAATPTEGTRRSRDLFAAIFTAFIAIILVLLAGLLLMGFR
ncbi:MAG: hypothetical protein ABFD46_05330 [Armatimonadota bacterium]